MSPLICMHHFKWAYILKSVFAVRCGCNNPSIMSLMDIKCINEVDVVSDHDKYQCILLNQYSLFFLPMLILVGMQERHS